MGTCGSKNNPDFSNIQSFGSSEALETFSYHSSITDRLIVPIGLIKARSITRFETIYDMDSNSQVDCANFNC
jgi:hypothetical protein